LVNDLNLGLEQVVGCRLTGHASDRQGDGLRLCQAQAPHDYYARAAGGAEVCI
jgi:hypothetical protein